MHRPTAAAASPRQLRNTGYVVQRAEQLARRGRDFPHALSRCGSIYLPKKQKEIRAHRLPFFLKRFAICSANCTSGCSNRFCVSCELLGNLGYRPQAVAVPVRIGTGGGPSGFAPGVVGGSNRFCVSYEPKLHRQRQEVRPRAASGRRSGRPPGTAMTASERA
jgi:hypothetical protein